MIDPLDMNVPEIGKKVESIPVERVMAAMESLESELKEFYTSQALDLEDAIQRVRDLHSPFIYEKDGQQVTSNLCNGCQQCWGCGENGGSTYSDGSKCDCQTYPCPTIKALDNVADE